MPKFPTDFITGEGRIDGHQLPPIGLYTSFNKDINDVNAYGPVNSVFVTGQGHFIQDWLYLTSGQHVEIEFQNQSGLYIDHFDDVAFDFWMLNQTGQPVNARIIDKYLSPSGYYIGISGSFLDIRILTNSTPTIYTGSIPIYSGIHHCFVAFDRTTNKIKTFVDGVQDSNIDTISLSGLFNNQSDFIIGRSYSGNYLFSGLIGDMRYYNFGQEQMPYDLPNKVMWTYRNPGEIHPVLSGSAKLRYKFDDDLDNTHFDDISGWNQSGLCKNFAGSSLYETSFLQSGISYHVPHRVSGYWNDLNGAIDSDYDIMQPDGLFVTYKVMSGINYSIPKGGVSLRWKPSETSQTVSGHRVLFNSDGLACIYYDGSTDKFYSEIFNVSGQWILCSSFQAHDFEDEYIPIQLSWDNRTGMLLFVSGAYSGNVQMKWSNWPV